MSRIAVKRDGPRGWHWIARENYDPAVHVRHVLDPLDHDGDGRKGGSMPDVVEEVLVGDGTGEALAPIEEPAVERTSPARKPASNKKGAKQ
jgi:hypothetical protein